MSLNLARYTNSGERMVLELNGQDAVTGYSELLTAADVEAIEAEPGIVQLDFEPEQLEYYDQALSSGEIVLQYELIETEES